MDERLAGCAREIYADNLFNLIMENYVNVNQDYIQKQISITSEYLTEEQKKELRKLGYET